MELLNIYKQKYIKYKMKYAFLKKQIGGGDDKLHLSDYFEVLLTQVKNNKTQIDNVNKDDAYKILDRVVTEYQRGIEVRFLNNMQNSNYTRYWNIIVAKRMVYKILGEVLVVVNNENKILSSRNDFVNGSNISFKFEDLDGSVTDIEDAKPYFEFRLLNKMKHLEFNKTLPFGQGVFTPISNLLINDQLVVGIFIKDFTVYKSVRIGFRISESKKQIELSSIYRNNGLYSSAYFVTVLLITYLLINNRIKNDFTIVLKGILGTTYTSTSSWNMSNDSPPDGFTHHASVNTFIHNFFSMFEQSKMNSIKTTAQNLYNENTFIRDYVDGRLLLTYDTYGEVVKKHPDLPDIETNVRLVYLWHKFFNVDFGDLNIVNDVNLKYILKKKVTECSSFLNIMY